MPSPPSIEDGFCLFQELAKMVADTLHAPLEEVKDMRHQLC